MHLSDVLIQLCMAVLGVKELAREKVDAALSLVPRKQKPAFIAKFKEAVQAEKDRTETLKKIAQEEDQHHSLIEAGTIKTSGNWFPEVSVEFGKKLLHIDEKQPGTLFRLNEGAIKAYYPSQSTKAPKSAKGPE